MPLLPLDRVNQTEEISGLLANKGGLLRALRRRTDMVLMVYLLVTAVLGLLFHRQLSDWLLIVPLHLLACGLIWSLRSWSERAVTAAVLSRLVPIAGLPLTL